MNHSDTEVTERQIKKNREEVCLDLFYPSVFTLISVVHFSCRS